LANHYDSSSSIQYSASIVLSLPFPEGLKESKYNKKPTRKRRVSKRRIRTKAETKARGIAVMAKGRGSHLVRRTTLSGWHLAAKRAMLFRLVPKTLDVDLESLVFLCGFIIKFPASR